MKERLNLTIDTELLAAMKRYAASKEMSVSELVESYFRGVTKPLNRRNILDLVDDLDAPGRSRPTLAELEAELIAWAKQPGPFTKLKKGRHGV